MSLLRRVSPLVLLVFLAPLYAADAPDPEPSDDRILYEGPIPGVVVTKRRIAGDTQEVKGTIQFVTKDAVFIRRPGGSVDVFIGTKTPFVKVEAQDGKLAWTWDEKKNELKGPTSAIRRPDTSVVTPPSESEAKYLFFALERLQQRTDQALLEGDVKLLKYLKERAELLREYASKKGVPGRLLDLYDSLPAYVERQKTVEIERSDFMETHGRKVSEVTLRDKEAGIRATMRQTKALGEVYRNAIPSVSVGGYFGRWGTGSGYVSAHYNYGGAMAGVMNMMVAQQGYELEKLRLMFAKDILDTEKAKKYAELDKRITANREARMKEIARGGESIFGLPRDKEYEQTQELLTNLQLKGDYRPLVAILGERSTRDAGKEKWGNPYTLHDMYHATAQLPTADREKQSDALFQLATQATDAIKFVPGGPIYNADRAELMRSAAGLANLSAIMESKDGGWASVYSPKAAYGARLIERAMEFDRVDGSGESREQLGVALTLAGRKTEALRYLTEIRESRKTSPTFLYNLARVYGVNGMGKEGIAALEDAVAGGFNDVKSLALNPDFIALRGTKFDALVTPNLHVVFVWARNAIDNSHRMEITNRSPFTLTNVRVTFEMVMTNGKKKTFTQKIDRLDPKQQFDWKDVCSDAQRLVSTAFITFEADQGKTKKFKPEAK
ncbi:tetratricopeptide repeat protein [Limnoglobus roseus]|uniref:Tetratricopeptide repeat protein n=1 Tax=Limnoglobus roseus TaxID=2598579 RepID=A0A5C1ATR3_9BACT|nr:hypothetical protein [Limnoglobus roseus]QEL20992.1 hypothetical protein PX52LOC_08120 [Limnoglobus roseus]